MTKPKYNPELDQIDGIEYGQDPELRGLSIEVSKAFRAWEERRGYTKQVKFRKNGKSNRMPTMLFGKKEEG